MLAEFTIRLLTDDGALLGWTTQMAESKPQGRPRSTPFKAVGPSTFEIEQDGIATQLAVHWHDLDVARLSPMTFPTEVKKGQVMAFHWIEPVWMIKGSEQPVPLPPVTLRKKVVISPPPAMLGAVGTR
jgi:hypothetical protein